jgi:Tol biopolymer transport system component
MTKKVMIKALLLILLAAGLMTGCAPTPLAPTYASPTEAPAATSTPVTPALPTPTPIPPTYTPPIPPTYTPPAPPTGVPTFVPAGTSTPFTPAAAYATQEAARQTTVVARATASPFPTAGPATVQTGQPSIATTRRDGLSFELCLPKDTYLAGEGGQAEATLRNDGPETVFVRGDGEHLFLPVLLDEQGHEPVPWPWSPMRLPGIPYAPRKLEPGQVITDTLNFQVPPEEQAAGHAYVLWAETSFGRPAPDRPEGWDNLWLHLETGPIPLQVTPPDPSQQLVAELEADRDGWRLQVTDTSGRVPPGPLWGFHEVVSFGTTATGPLRDSTDGMWSGAWGERVSQSDSQISMRAWVAAPGYVTAAITQTVPGTGDVSSWFGAWEPPTPQTFDSLETAQATLDFPLYRPGWLPTGTVLDGVQVETRTSGERRWTDVSQMYRLPDNTWLELIQMVTTDHYASAGWGEARYAWEARPVTIGQNTGYVIQCFNWWVLDWKCDDVGLELRAPVQALSLENLLAIATGVKSPEGTCPPAPTATPWISTPPPPPTPTETSYHEQYPKSGDIIEHTPTPDWAATATVSALATENARLATQVATLAVPTSTPTPSLGKLAYVQGGDIWVKALPDGEPQRLTTDGRNSAPRWSFSGVWLTFHKGDDLWIMRTDDTDARQLPTTSLRDYVWSPVADRLAYIDDQSNLCIIEEDDLNTRSLGEGNVRLRLDVEEQPPTIHGLAWSPDGRRLAYVLLFGPPDAPRDHVNIQYLDLESGPRELFAPPSPAQHGLILAGWTPDGQSILFWRDLYFSASAMASGLPLLRVPLDGGDPVEVADSTLLHPDFWSRSPTDQHVALTVGGGRETWTNKYITLLNLETASLERLTDETVSAFSPAFSPDGWQIAYVAAPDIGFVGGGDPAKAGAAQRRIWIMNTDGSDQHPLTDNPAYRDERPLWSADGSHLLFARMDAEDRASLWLILTAGGEPRRVVDELTPLPGPAPGWFGYYGYVDWDQLFDWWRGPAKAPESVVMPTPGPLPTARPLVSPTPAPSPPTPASLPSALPGRLIYESAGDIWIVERGQPPRVLLTDGSDPHLSPGGNRLVFWRAQTESSLPDLWLADFTCPAASALCQVNERRLIGPTEFGSPLIYGLAWSPDGRTVALTTGAEAKTIYSEDLWLVDVETGDCRQVLDDGGGVPCYSPNGAWIALNMPYAGYQRGQLSFIAADGSSYRPLFDDLIYCEGKWLPDGVLVAGFIRLSQTTKAEDITELWQVPVMGEPVRLATIPAAHSFCWSADGRRLAYLADDPAGWLHIAQGDGSQPVAVPGTDERTWAHSWSPDEQFLAVIRDGQHFFAPAGPDPALIPMPTPFWLWLDDKSYLTAEWITDDPQADRGHFEVSRTWLDGRREFLFTAESLNELAYRP